jgi:peptidoglycan/LPS O-acetylase OafA/YrhL
MIAAGQDSGRASIIHNSLGWLAGKLSRVTSSREFIPEVDGLRCLAILPVLILHSSAHILISRGWTTFAPDWGQRHGPILRAISTGAIGVPIFFVISGFIVALPFARHALQGGSAPKLSRYFLRRLTRIEPPYILALTAMYLFTRAYRELLPDYLAGLFYLHKAIFGTWNPINGVTWSLEVEVFFYILAPWLTRVYRIRGDMRRRLLQLTLIGSSSYFVHCWLIPHGPPRLNDTLLTAIPFFLAGMLLADLYGSGLLRRSRRIGWDFAAAGSGIGMVYAAGWDWGRLYWLTPFMIMILFLGGIEGRSANWFLCLRPVTIVGGMCYTAYLWHIPLLILMRDSLSKLVPNGLRDGPAAVLFCLVTVPVLIAVSAPLFYFVEKPFMNGPGSRSIEKALRRISEAVRRRKPVASGAAA